MPEEHVVVMNTGPVLALVSALGDLKLLEELYDRVVIPRRVAEEILAGGFSRVRSRLLSTGGFFGCTVGVLPD